MVVRQVSRICLPKLARADRFWACTSADSDGLAAGLGKNTHTHSEARAAAASSRLRNEGERLCSGGHRLFAGGDELLQMLDAEPGTCLPIRVHRTLR